MLSLTEARFAILNKITCLPPELIGIDAAVGRVCAAPIHARLNQPPTAVSSMDGYALASAAFHDHQAFKQVATIPAGKPWDGSLDRGQCARIFTGGVIPAGADCVIIQENATKDKDRPAFIYFSDAPTKNQWIRPKAYDFAIGAQILSAGSIIHARDIGVIASANHPWLTVTRQPRVTIMVTGDELVLPGETIQAGKIINSNGLALKAMLEQQGAIVTLLPIIRDDEDHLIAQARHALKACDLLVTTGGASVGDHDLVQSAFQKIGLQLEFSKTAVRPGKPTLFGMFGDVPYIGLPGNPVSVAVGHLLYIMPALLKMQGLGLNQSDEALSQIAFSPALCADSLPKNDQRASFLRARIDGIDDRTNLPLVTAAHEQDSAQQVNMARSDCLIYRPVNAPATAPHQRISILNFPPPLSSF